MEIYINDVLIDTITQNPTNWSRYINTVYLNSGVNTIKFLGTGVSSYAIIITGIKLINRLVEVKPPAIALTNIRLYEPPSLIDTGTTIVYNNNFKSTTIDGYLNVIDYTTSGKRTIEQITTNYLICKNNLTMLADGTQSIYYKDISGFSIGRIFGNRSQIFFDYHDVMSFRYCTGPANTLAGVKLTLGSAGIIVNSSTITSTYNLDVYGNNGAYIRGPLKVKGDITYQDNTSLVSTFSGYNTSITSISGKINTISGLVSTANTNITSISGRVATDNTNITSVSGLVATANTNITSISGLIANANTNITSISGLVATANTNITSISGRVNTINSAATYSSASIIANGFVPATYFKLTNPSNFIYRVGPATTVNLTSASAYSYNYSALPIGLYIANYQINLINTNTVNGTCNVTECRSQITNYSTSTVIYHQTDITTHAVPKTGLQSYVGMTILNNTSVHDYQFYLIAYFAGTYQILSGTASNSTFLQFTRIG